MNKAIIGAYTLALTLIVSSVVALIGIGGGTTEASARVIAPQPVIKVAAPTNKGIDLAFSSAGTVATVLVAEGDVVEAGQLLALLDSIEQEAKISKARADLARAKARLDESRSQEHVVTDPAANETIEAELASALRELVIIAKDFENRMEQATADRAQAVEDYRAVFTKYLGLELTSEQLGREPQQVLHQVGVDLQKVFNPTLRPKEYGMLVFTAPGVGIAQAPVDDLRTAWNEPLVYAWLNYYTGEIYVAFNESVARDPWAIVARDEKKIDIAKDLTDAWEALSSAQERIGIVQFEQSTVLAVASDNLGRARLAMANLAEVTTVPDAGAIELAMAEVEVAKTDLVLAEIALEATEVYAPIAGTVGRINRAAILGGWVAEGAAVLTLIG